VTDPFTAWLDTTTRHLDAVENLVSSLRAVPAGDLAPHAAALLGLCRRAGVDPRLEHPAKGIEKHLTQLEGPHREHFARRLFEVLWPPTLAALEAGGNDTARPVIYTITLFRAGCCFVSEATGETEVDPFVTSGDDLSMRMIPLRRVHILYDKLSKDHVIRRHLRREDAWLSDRITPTVLLGRPRIVRGPEGVEMWPPAWVELGQALDWTREAERLRRQAIEERQRRESLERESRKREWEQSPAGLRKRVEELESQARSSQQQPATTR
jgi:hypothetical protein